MRKRTPPELAALRTVFESGDPVPGAVVAAAYAAGGYASGPVPGLELVADSAQAARRVRSRTRELTFTTAERTLDMDLVPARRGFLLATGIVLEHAGAVALGSSVVVRHPRGECSGKLDEHGSFRIAGIPRGPISVVLRPGCGAAAGADWLVC
ncbi:hypothetical protein IQ251_10340 [Saccharopolyspora sp. HNM0983]|uniref:Uncharacterized protein n=1 Tax=Saccharopolyspora montiporae TaxID=2781240 RepID=A0A929FZR1_9PSEU|nr:hypothetical protein [Saccharopolyspora sp. HNM0983]MBE9374840.1 hypothetical protein [Saccharopolyspora sp. HNM0983]